MKPEEIFKNKIFSVSEFNEFLNSVLQPMIVTVEGEISDWRVSQGKFIWFNIKDENETLQCFSLVYKIHQPVEEGMKVKITGYPRIYGKSGRFSFFVEKLELSGEGSLKRAFEILRLNFETTKYHGPKIAPKNYICPESNHRLARYYPVQNL